jgi:hypothetical protein
MRKCILFLRIEVLTVMTMLIVVVWVVLPYNLVGGYRGFGFLQ